MAEPPPDDRRPPPPEVLADALQDRVHRESGVARAAGALAEERTKREAAEAMVRLLEVDRNACGQLAYRADLAEKRLAEVTGALRGLLVATKDLIFKPPHRSKAEDGVEQNLRLALYAAERALAGTAQPTAGRDKEG